MPEHRRLVIAGEAEVHIDGISVNGHPQPTVGPLLLSASSSADIDCEFSSSTARLLYRMDGIDEVWNDISDEMRIAVKFRSIDGREVRSFDLKMLGHNAGWSGNENNSLFTSRTETITAPSNACRLQLILYSGGPPETQGVMWIAGLHLWRLRDGVAPLLVQDLSLSPPPNGDTTWHPPGWIRGGSDTAMSMFAYIHGSWSIGFRDDSADSYAVWEMPPTSWIPLDAGERYRIDWQEMFSVGGSRSANIRYRSMAPGRYRFRVGMASVDGLPTGIETALDIYLPEPLWHRRWFWALAGSVMVLPFFWAWFTVARSRMRLRLERAERQRAVIQERARIAQDLHDDLGANLTQIALLSELAQGGLPTADPARDVMDRVFRTASALARQLDEAVWAVNPNQDTVEGLAAFLCKYAQDFLTPAGVRCRLKVPEELPNLALTALQRHNLLLAVKEALHNIVQHALALTMTMSLDCTAERLTIQIRDDGCGFPGGLSAPNADGLGNMSERMARIGGTCSVESNDGGTMVRLSIPIGTGET